MKNERVMFLIPKLSTGGAETIVKDYVLSLKNRNVAVSIIVDETSTEWPNERIIRDNDIKIYKINYQNFLASGSIFARLVNRIYRDTVGKIVYQRQIKHIFKEFKPTVIHIHLPLLNKILILRKLLKGKKLFYTCHSVPKRIFGDKDSKEYKAAIELVQKYGMTIIALHDSMKVEIAKLLNINNVIVINNPINLQRFMGITNNKELIRKKNGIPSDAFVIGHVGRFIEVKNHKLIVQIFKQYCKSDEKAFLLLIGNGELKQRVADELNLLGLNNKYLILSDRSDIPELYLTMDVFIMPSLVEGFPLVAIEAQASGLSCVISDQIPKGVCLSDRVEIVKISDTPEKWVEAIQNTKKNARIIPNKVYEFDIEKVVDRLYDVYSK